ncbi:MAG: hypothetical protein AAGL66_19770 [Pseudomonadota bacterium]
MTLKTMEQAPRMPNKNLAMYGVSRIDDDRYHTHAWRVSLRRRGKKLVKNFPDKKHGGRCNALKKAQTYRDQLLENYPPITRQEFSRLPRSHNTSGITGVYRYAKKYTLADGREKESWYWEAHWPTDSGRYETVNFAVNKFGEDLARRLAVRAREEGLQQVEGVFWASERGVTAVEQSDPPNGNVETDVDTSGRSAA